jgi:hypothetical protein
LQHQRGAALLINAIYIIPTADVEAYCHLHPGNGRHPEKSFLLSHFCFFSGLLKSAGFYCELPVTSH